MFKISYQDPIFLTHKELGECLITSVRGGTVNIKFIDSNKTAKYNIFDLQVNKPDSDFSCSNQVYEDYVRIYNRASYARTSWMCNNKPDISYKSEFNLSAYIKSERGPVTRALNIPFNTDEEKIESIAFLAALQPKIEARVYEGDSLDEFIQNYPNQPYTIDYCESSQIHATSFRINFSSNATLYNIMPQTLKEHVNPKSYAIFRTAFIQELMDDYGFNFGTEQDIEHIKNKMKETTYENYFNECYDNFLQQLKENNLCRTYSQTEEQPEIDFD